MSSIHVDSFENGTLNRRDHGNAEAVLAAARHNPRFSTFEMTDRLMRTLLHLVADGKLKEVPAEYPWHVFKPVSVEVAP